MWRSHGRACSARHRAPSEFFDRSNFSGDSFAGHASAFVCQRSPHVQQSLESLLFHPIGGKAHQALALGGPLEQLRLSCHGLPLCTPSEINEARLSQPPRCSRNGLMAPARRRNARSAIAKRAEYLGAQQPRLPRWHRASLSVPRCRVAESLRVRSLNDGHRFLGWPLAGLYLRSSDYHKPSAVELAVGEDGKTDRLAHNSFALVRYGVGRPSSA
jgi:hypothetical protein